MRLPFRPNCRPTALGPFPYVTGREAWDACLQYVPALLPLPLLAHAGEDPLTLAADGFAGVLIGPEHLAFDAEEAFAGLDALYLAYLQDRSATRALDLAAMDEWTQREAQIKRAELVSTVIMGPISTALRLVDEDGRTALSSTTLVDALAKHLYLRLQWQQSVVARTAKVVLHWLYEPYVSVVDSPFSPINGERAQLLWEETFGPIRGVRGIWAGEGADIPALLQNEMVEVLGMPMPEPSAAAEWAPLIEQFLRRRGVIGWGLIPSTVEGLNHSRIGRLAGRYNDVLHALEAAGVATTEVVAASMLMPEDTLGMLEPDEAEIALQLTNQLSGMLRHSYNLD